MNNLYNFINNNLFWLLVFPYILFGIIVLLMFIYRKDKTHSISRCMAYTKKRHYFFMILLIFGSLPLYTTLVFYLIPKYNGNIIVTITVILIYILQSVLAIFPDNEGIKRSIHLFAAFTTGFLTILFCLLLVLFGKMEFLIKLLPLQFVLTVSILLSLLLFNKKVRERAFVIEVISILDWIITIFCLAFL